MIRSLGRWRVVIAVCLVIGVMIGALELARAAGRSWGRGTTLAYASTRGGNADVYLLDIARHWLHPVTRVAGYDGEIAFAPDGSRIAFTSGREGNSDIFIMNLDGTGVRNLTRHPANETQPRWTADGRAVAFVSDWQGVLNTYLMNVDDASLNVQGWRAFASTRAYYEVFGTSPDGGRLVYVDSIEGRMSVVVRAANGLTTPISTTRGNSFNPIWSPNGTHLAFESNADGNFDIYIAPADGSGRAINLTAHPAADYAPAWSPDGTRIAFVSNRGGSEDIYIATIDGALLQRLTTVSGANTSPAWIP
jgi:Tol biopolymer transport system component